jgi:hypothetical protein
MRPTSRVTRALLIVLTAAMTASTADAAPPESRTLAAWKTYADVTDARITSELNSPRGFLASDFTGDREGLRRQVRQGSLVISRVTARDREGREIDIPGGTVQHWRGAVFLPGVTLRPLLDALRHPPERGPFPQDVLAMRVERRDPQALDLFMRMRRTAIVTVTYDTEHRVEFRPHDAIRASTRSVATRITEMEDAGSPGERALAPDDDHGYLWRMNSYWRYEQVDGGVIAEMESLTLSRNIPSAVRFLVDPIVNRIARESVERTLRGFRELYLARLI